MPPEGGPRPQKREAITHAARTVFGRDGYSRASVDAIAAEAGVSTRTIYNHFDCKEQLFASVLETSAAQVADGFVANVGRRITGDDLEGDLVAIGRALIAQQTDFPEHFAMVRQILPEAPHFPPAVLEAWQDAGPRRVELEVARYVEQLAKLGQLRVEDPAQAAVHLIALTAFPVTSRGRYGEPPLAKRETTRIITAGVRAFPARNAPIDDHVRTGAGSERVAAATTRPCADTDRHDLRQSPRQSGPQPPIDVPIERAHAGEPDVPGCGSGPQAARQRCSG